MPPSPSNSAPSNRESLFGTPTLLQSHPPQSELHTMVPPVQYPPTDHNRNYQGVGNVISDGGGTVSDFRSTHFQAAQAHYPSQGQTQPSLLDRLGGYADNIKSEPR